MNREERIYSVTMTGNELRLFSEFLKQKNFIDVNLDVNTNELTGSLNNLSGSLEDSTHNIHTGLNNLGSSLGGGLGKLGLGLGLGIGTAGIAGAYSRVKAAKLAAKRNKEEAEERYKTSESENKKKK